MCTEHHQYQGAVWVIAWSLGFKQWRAPSRLSPRGKCSCLNCRIGLWSGLYLRNRTTIKNRVSRLDLCDQTTVSKNRLWMWLEVDLCGGLKIRNQEWKLLKVDVGLGPNHYKCLYASSLFMLHFHLFILWVTCAR